MKKINLDMHKIWTIVLMVYIVCNSAFSYGDLRMLNTYALYLFLGTSAFCIFLKGKIKLNGLILSLVLYLLLMLVGMFYTPTDSSAAMGTLYDFLTMAVLCVCVIQYMDSQDDIEHVITAFMWAGVALAIYVYAQYGEAFWTIMQEATENKTGYIERLDGGLANANVIGMYAAISTVIAVFKLFYQRNPLWKKILYIAVIVFCFVINMAAASKKGLLFLVIAAFCIWFYNAQGSKNIWKQLLGLIILCLTIVAVVWMITNLKIFSAISARMEEFFVALSGNATDTSNIERSYMTRKGLEIWWEHLLLGAGTYASGYYFGVYCHNNYVEILMNSGFVGFCVFYVPQIVALCKYFLHVKTYKTSDSVFGLLVALLVGILACGVGLVYYYDRYFMMLIAMVVSASGMLKRQPKKTMLELGGKSA